MTKLLLLIHFASTWYLVGLCWLVQRVQYPLMSRVGAENYRAYEQGHVTQIGPVVAPMMILEVATALALLLSGEEVFRRPAFLASLGLLAGIWLSTFLLQVPLHNALGQGYDASAHTALVKTNWIRTLAWTARGAILTWLMHSFTFESAS
jgi:hypothetical protein